MYERGDIIQLSPEHPSPGCLAVVYKQTEKLIEAYVLLRDKTSKLVTLTDPTDCVKVGRVNWLPRFFNEDWDQQ